MSKEKRAGRGRPRSKTPGIEAPQILLEPAWYPTPNYFKGSLLSDDFLAIDQDKKDQYDREVEKMEQARWDAATSVLGLTDADMCFGGAFVAAKIFARLFPGFQLLPHDQRGTSASRWTPSDPATVRCYCRSLELRLQGYNKQTAWTNAAKEVFGSSIAASSLKTRWAEFRAYFWVKMFERIADDGPDGIRYVLDNMLPRWLEQVEKPTPGEPDSLMTIHRASRRKGPAGA